MSAQSPPALRVPVARAAASRRGAFLGAALATTYGEWLALAVVLAAATGLGLFSLLRTPAPFVDEAWNANRAWGMIRTGIPFGSMDSGVFERYPGYERYFPWLGTWLHTPAVRAFGPTLFAVRVTSLVFGLALLGAVYAIGRQLEGRRTALVAVALVAVSTPFLYSSHMGRHDVIVAAMGFWAIALYLSTRTPEQSRRLSGRGVLAGLLVGLTLDVHMNGIVYGPTVVALALLDVRWSIPALLRGRRFWSFALGAGAGVVFFLAIHVLPNPATYVALSALGPAGASIPILSPHPGVWLTSFGELTFLLFAAAPLGLPLLAPGLVLLLQRRTTGDRQLLILSAALFVSFAAVIRTKSAFYAILLSPAVDLLVTAFLVGYFERLRDPRYRGSLARYAAPALILGVTAFATRLSLAAVFDDPRLDFTQTLTRIADAVPTGATVMGPQTYWFGLPPDQPYLSWEQLVYYQGYAPQSTLDDAFRALGVDYFIVDTRMEHFIAEDASDLPPRYAHLYLTKANLRDFLSQHARLVGQVRTNTFGDVRIYSIIGK